MYLIVLIIFLFSSDLFSKEDNVYDIISKNPDLSTFKDYLDKTGLDDVLQKKFHIIGQFMLHLTMLLTIHLKN